VSPSFHPHSLVSDFSLHPAYHVVGRAYRWLAYVASALITSPTSGSSPEMVAGSRNRKAKRRFWRLVSRPSLFEVLT